MADRYDKPLRIAQRKLRNAKTNAEVRKWKDHIYELEEKHYDLQERKKKRELYRRMS